MAASTVVEWTAAYWLHKRKHKWLARAFEWSGAVGSGEGILTSKTGVWGKVAKPKGEL